MKNLKSFLLDGLLIIAFGLGLVTIIFSKQLFADSPVVDIAGEDMKALYYSNCWALVLMAILLVVISFICIQLRSTESQINAAEELHYTQRYGTFQWSGSVAEDETGYWGRDPQDPTNGPGLPRQSGNRRENALTYLQADRAGK